MGKHWADGKHSGKDHGGKPHRGDFKSTTTGKWYTGAKHSEDFKSAVTRRKKAAHTKARSKTSHAKRGVNQK